MFAVQETQRPYSYKELNHMREVFFLKNRIGKILVTHKLCGHSYLLRENGLREMVIKKTCTNFNTEIIDQCSFCWAIKYIGFYSFNDPTELHEILVKYLRLVSKYNDKSYKFTQEDVQTEMKFYIWIYGI